jgi:hypothetical protein
MQVEDVDSVSTQLAQRLIRMLLESIGLVNTCFVRKALCCKRESAVLPLRLSRPSLLKSADVRTRRIDLIVTLGLKVVEMLGKFIEVCDSSSGFLVRTC